MEYLEEWELRSRDYYKNTLLEHAEVWIRLRIAGQEIIPSKITGQRMRLNAGFRLIEMGENGYDGDW